MVGRREACEVRARSMMASAPFLFCMEMQRGNRVASSGGRRRLHREVQRRLEIDIAADAAGFVAGIDQEFGDFEQPELGSEVE